MFNSNFIVRSIENETLTSDIITKFCRTLLFIAKVQTKNAKQ